MQTQHSTAEVTREGHIVLTTTLSIRELLERDLIGITNPQPWQKGAHEDAAKNLAESVSAVPQVCEAVLSMIEWGVTEGGDAFNKSIVNELRRRVAIAMGPEGEVIKQLTEDVQGLNGRVANFQETLRQRDYDIVVLKVQLANAETGRKAANDKLREARNLMGLQTWEGDSTLIEKIKNMRLKEEV